MEDYTDREFMIFNISELPNIDFTQVIETSEESVRKSLDGTKTFVKWNGPTPQCVIDLTTKEGPYTYSQILQILSTSDWDNQNPPT